jgi:mRNA-degrading endonuclease toxin of MazEF toxin-antitoxin module
MGKQTVRVLIEQITAVDSTKLGDFAGRLNASEMADVNASLKGVLGLY